MNYRFCLLPLVLIASNAVCKPLVELDVESHMTPQTGSENHEHDNYRHNKNNELERYKRKLVVDFDSYKSKKNHVIGEREAPQSESNRKAVLQVST